MEPSEREDNNKNDTCSTPKILRLPQIIDGDCNFINYIVSEIYSHLLYVLTFTAIIANIIKIISTARSTHAWTASHVYLVNIALAHVILLLSCPAWGMYLSHKYDWHLGKYACSAINFTYALGHFGSILFTCIICSDRMITLYFPRTSRQLSNVTFGKLVAITSWGLSIIIAVLSYIYTTFNAYGQSKHFCVSLNVVHVLNLATVRGLILFLFPNIVIPTLTLLPCFARIVLFQFHRQPGLSYDTEKAIKLDIMYIASFLILCLFSSYALCVVCLVYFTSSACLDDCLWASVINVSNETARLLTVFNALVSPLIYMSKYSLTACSNLLDFRNTKLCSCHCLHQIPTEGVQVIRIVKISSITDNHNNLKIQVVNSIL